MYLCIEAQVLQRRSESSIYSLFCGPRPLERQVFTTPQYLLVSFQFFLLLCITAERVEHPQSRLRRTADLMCEALSY
jgi:hypothetical protein